jgi:hypothetical protein
MNLQQRTLIFAKPQTLDIQQIACEIAHGKNTVDLSVVIPSFAANSGLSCKVFLVFANDMYFLKVILVNKNTI